MPSSPSSDAGKSQRTSSVSTPTLLNACFTRLQVLADGLQHACDQQGVSGLHHWMHSYGKRLHHFVDVLRDEGARTLKSVARSAASLHLEKTCSKSTLLLTAVISIQTKLLAVYEQLNLRLDMDEHLYDELVSQESELREVLSDMRRLQLDYAAQGE